MSSPLATALAQLEQGKSKKLFLPIWHDRQRKLNIFKVEGKLHWCNDKASVYELFEAALINQPGEYQSARLYALSDEDYMRNKAMINYRADKGIPMSRNDILFEEADRIVLDQRPELGMFVAMQSVFQRIDKKMQEQGPSAMLEAIAMVQKLIKEAAPCQSCGCTCHVPSFEKYDSEQAKKMLELVHKNSCVCLPCGAKILASVATVHNKVNNLNIDSKILQLKSMTFTDLELPKIDAAQKLMEDIMGHLGQMRMIVDKGDKLEDKILKKKSPTPGWLN